MRWQKDGLAAMAAVALLLAAGRAAPGALLRAACLLEAPPSAARAALNTVQAAAVEADGDVLAALPEPESESSLPPPPAAESPEPIPEADVPYVQLLDDGRRPEPYGTVVEKTYGQGSGDAYIPCGAGTIKNNTKVSAQTVAGDIAQGMPFAVELNSAEPQVLIMHTHATETYRLSEGLWFDPADTARSTDRAVDMCAVGAVMADTLNAAGVNTLHDTSLNDYPSYTGSYANSRAVVQDYLARYPSIKVVLDVHRDAIETNGSRVAPVCTVNGRQAAQVMIISGCDNGTTVQLPNYLQNLRFAAAWEDAMEGMYPGLTRPVLFSYRFYNQDLTTGSLLIEVGGHGNNLNEALYAGKLAADALARLFGAG